MANINCQIVLSFLAVVSACTEKKSSPPCKGPCPITRPRTISPTVAPDKSSKPTSQNAPTPPSAQQAADSAITKVALVATPKAPEVTWLGSTIIQIHQPDVLVFGHKVSVVYILNLVEDDHGLPGGVELELLYSDGQGHITTIFDKNNDQRADSIDGIDEKRIVFGYSRNQKEARQIFAKADALLKRFRKELEVDDLVRIGPPSEGSLFDPFPVK